jgi:cell division protein FtsB
MFTRLRSYIPTAVLAFLIFYFGFQALTGDRGLLSRARRELVLEDDRRQLAVLQAERQRLELQDRLLRDQSLSADLLDERARSLLGFADPRDYVIRTRP